ncbi:polyprenyl synthetase family protein [Streptomyces viridochromogenes]|uniref:Putative Geranylgeranyl diphosphate synthase n=1 Tax=Streptomyces viridochromogenes Tue57 TaxID=1160705 RepID=L8P1H8_STRVR|nr:polyprenyl synthetase family protein [Streptomyces viridochromogenes]ELS50350.1 putative Geranylgeranyl diphosphate synthase [Streptomyces viridochromogenes Tue57]
MTPLGTEADTFLAKTRARIDAMVNSFLTQKANTAPSPYQAELATVLRDFLAGGKRLRPLLCVAGWHAADGQGDTTAVTRLAASLELFHAFALIHDDVMDASDTRRGRPTLHRTLTAQHRSTPHSHHDPHALERFGTNAAILLGDLALTWADELLHTTPICEPHRTTVLHCLDTMRTEIMTGQYLDLLTTGTPTPDLDTALTVIHYKTATYTVQRPLHLGALLAAASQPVLDACTAYGLPLGEAFQLRDDLLDTFGTPSQTGKTCLDDLRQGKHTALLALALSHADPAQTARLRSLVGRPDLTEETAAEIRALLTDTGARAIVEKMIATRHRQAMAALDTAPFPPAATKVLARLADRATARTS